MFQVRFFKFYFDLLCEQNVLNSRVLDIDISFIIQIHIGGVDSSESGVNYNKTLKMCSCSIQRVKLF